MDYNQNNYSISRLVDQQKSKQQEFIYFQINSNFLLTSVTLYAFLDQ